MADLNLATDGTHADDANPKPITLPFDHPRVRATRRSWLAATDNELCGTARLIFVDSFGVGSKPMDCESWGHYDCAMVKADRIYGRAWVVFPPIIWYVSLPYETRLGSRMSSRRSAARKKGTDAESLLLRRVRGGQRVLEVFSSANLAAGKPRKPPLSMRALGRSDALLLLAEVLMTYGMKDYDWSEGWRVPAEEESHKGVFYIKSPTIRAATWWWFCHLVEARGAARPYGDLEYGASLSRELPTAVCIALFESALNIAIAFASRGSADG